VTRDGRREPFRKENRINGTRVYIGSPSVNLLPGIYTYELAYETDNQLGFFDTHDELYWNVTGNGWIFPIATATATVELPDGAEPQKLEAYTGPQGARGKNYTANIVDRQAHFRTTRTLNPEEGLTIVVGWPKGFVAPPTRLEKWITLIRANQSVALAAGCLVLALIYYFMTWFMVGRDPKRGTIIPLYEPPKGFSPAAVRYLGRMGFDNRTLTAAILGLASKGKLTIREYLPKTYTLLNTEAGLSSLTHEEIGLYCKLFTDGESLALKKESYETLQDATKELKNRLEQTEERIYFLRNLRYWVPGLVFLVVAIVAMIYGVAMEGLYTAIPLMSVLTVMGILIAIVFYYLLRAPTAVGRQILDQIEGFKLYLSVAEKDRLNLENPPERTPALFEMFLPYAVALGVEQKWAEQFASVLAVAGAGEAAAARYRPSWYSGSGDSSWSGTNLTSMTHSMSHSFSSAISSASTAPGSNSGFSWSGGSGSGGGGGGSFGGGGGGSSGGGGGGGGGGGW
jgi:hypothetical protein